VIDVCTVLLRFSPGARWPLLLAAVRDEFTDRSWDPPAAYWPAEPSVWGGRDRTAGGTWLAVDRDRPAVAALLNGIRRDPPADGVPRPTRGSLALAALRSPEDSGAGDGAEDNRDRESGAGQSGGVVPGIADAAMLARYDSFHLLRADIHGVRIWSWDGVALSHQSLAAGDHIVVNIGPDRHDDPLVPHFRPLVAALPDPEPAPGRSPSDAWPGWIDLLRGDGLAPDDARGLIIDHEIVDAAGVVHHYGSTSASLVALAADGRVRYDFTATPATPHWYEVDLER
jgi:hypothetical protein